MVTPMTGSSVSNVGAPGDYRMDALLKGLKWGGPAGTAFNVTYSFPQVESGVFSTNASAGYGPKTGSGEPWDPDFRSLNAVQRHYVSEAMDAWSEVANIAAVEVADNATEVGDIRVAFSGRVDEAGASAWAYYPYAGAVGGDIWLNPFTGNFDNPAPGSGGYYVFLHEIGHALGLSHSFGGGMSVLDGSENTQKYTVMAYAGHGGVGGYPHTPMLYDILAIQHLYGANYSTRDGDTTYGFSATSESFSTIWDGDGVDTLDASAQSRAARISLVAGTYSSIGPNTSGGSALDNVAIAFGVTIENAIGGAGSDTISGNAAHNILKGLGGDDVLSGGAGDDTLRGGTGDDTVAGNAGDDTLMGGAGRDMALFGSPVDHYDIAFLDGTSLSVTFAGTDGIDEGRDMVTGFDYFSFAGVVYNRTHLASATGTTVFKTGMVSPYGGEQDVSGEFSVADGGTTLRLAGNTWKKIPFAYAITAATVIEFDFRAPVEGEVQGVGFDDDQDFSPDRFFQLNGTEHAAQWHRDFDTYSGDRWVHFRIGVGEFFGGPMDYLTFVNDHDVGTPTAEAQFRNIRVFEDAAGGVEDDNEDDGIVFESDTVRSYGSYQKVTGTYAIADDGKTLNLVGNTWHKISVFYQVTAHTVIELDFRAQVMGDVQGIGFDIDDGFSPKWFFKFCGTQTNDNWHRDFDTYDGGDWVHYRIDVGDFFTGFMDYMTFANDHDVKTPTAEAQFRDIRIYEDIDLAVDEFPLS